MMPTCQFIITWKMDVSVNLSCMWQEVQALNESKIEFWSSVKVVKTRT